MQAERRDPKPSGREETGPREPDAALENDPVVGELRKLYDGIVDEPIPDHLVDLLRKLDEVERSR